MEIVLSKNFGLYVADYYFFFVLKLNDSCVILVTGWKWNAKLVTNRHFLFLLVIYRTTRLRISVRNVLQLLQIWRICK